MTIHTYVYIHYIFVYTRMYHIYISAAEFGANDGACVRYTQPTTCYMCGCMPSTERESQSTSQKHDPIALWSCHTIYKDLAGRLALARAHAQHTQPSQPSPLRAHSTHENHTHHSTGDLTPFAALINLGQSSASSHFLFHQLQVYLLHFNARRNVSALGVITCARHLLCGI